MKLRDNLTYERAKELLILCVGTGQLFWAVKRRGSNGGVNPGDLAGWATPSGYLALGIDGTIYRAHRVVWLLSTGCWPTAFIDHIDGDKKNNKPSNLRDVSHVINMQNQKGAMSCNRSGYFGVYKNRKNWAAEIKVNKKRIHLGTYKTPEEAHKVYLMAKRQMHKGCTI